MLYAIIYLLLNGIYTEEVLVSAYSRSWAVKLEQPEAVSLDLHTVCNVSELYFDVKKMLKLWQIVKDTEAWHAEVHGDTKSRTRLSY